jgi:hypothetical protein
MDRIGRSAASMRVAASNNEKAFSDNPETRHPALAVRSGLAGATNGDG